MLDRTFIAGVCERDIDLLVLEEIVASPAFRELLLASAGFASRGDLAFVDARRSVTHASGESDLEMRLVNKSGAELRLLIENKVGAGFQPEQAARYRIRGDAYVRDGICTVYRTLLLAPRRYFGAGFDTRGFDATLPYESLVQWFEAAELGDRSRFKLSMLRSAIDRGVLGYQPDVDNAATDFWREYWLLSLQVAPQLEMRKPDPKPSGAGFISFRPSERPTRSRVVHKYNRGYVDLEISGAGGRTNQVRTVLAKWLESDMTIERATGSAAIRVFTPKLLNTRSIDSQLSEAKQGLATAVRLLAWARSLPNDVWQSCLGGNAAGAPHAPPNRS